MIKIAAFPKCYLDPISVDRTMSVFDWISMSQSLGAEGLELYEGFFWSTDDEFVLRVREALAAVDTVMPMLCCSPDLSHPDRDERRRALEREARFIEISRELGGPGTACRVLSGQRHPGVSIEQGLEWASEAISELLVLARELDVVLALENHYKDGRWSYPELAQLKFDYLHLLHSIPPSAHFGAQYDPSNALLAGEDPVLFLRDVAPLLRTVQASDRRMVGTLTEPAANGYPSGLMHGVLGTGLIDFDGIFEVLVEIGYDGWISVEDGMNGMAELQASVDFLKRKREEFYPASTGSQR